MCFYVILTFERSDMVVIDEYNRTHTYQLRGSVYHSHLEDIQRNKQ